MKNNNKMAAAAAFIGFFIIVAVTLSHLQQPNKEVIHAFSMYDFNSSAVPDSTLFEVSMKSDSTGDTLSLGAYHSRRISFGSLQEETLDTTALIPVFAGTDTIFVVTIPWNGYVRLYVGRKEIEEEKRESIIFTQLVPFRRPD